MKNVEFPTLISVFNVNLVLNTYKYVKDLGHIFPCMCVLYVYVWCLYLDCVCVCIISYEGPWEIFSFPIFLCKHLLIYTTLIQLGENREKATFTLKCYWKWFITYCIVVFVVFFLLLLYFFVLGTFSYYYFCFRWYEFLLIYLYLSLCGFLLHFVISLAHAIYIIQFTRAFRNLNKCVTVRIKVNMLMKNEDGK